VTGTATGRATGTGRSAPTGLHALMDRYLDGDARAFAALHAALAPRLTAFLVHLVRDTAAADDLVQATWLKAHLARDRFHVQGASPDGAVQAWYFTIARNLAVDHLRAQVRDRRRREPGEPEDGERDRLAEIPSDLPTAEELEIGEAEAQEIASRVRDALAQLPAGQREIVELHKFQGLSMAEIATRLRIREGAVRVRAHRAYKALARWLTPAVRGLLLLLARGGGA
jgi:RNA polymerase sigma-70 factor (ECF subfamily)